MSKRSSLRSVLSDTEVVEPSSSAALTFRSDEDVELDAAAMVVVGYGELGCGDEARQWAWSSMSTLTVSC